jgi:hypothetical protein
VKHGLDLAVIGVALSLVSIVLMAAPGTGLHGRKGGKKYRMKATVGVGGRCYPAEAAKDTARDAAVLEDKGPLEKRRDDDGPGKKAAKKVLE